MFQNPGFLQKQEYLCEESRIQKMRRLYYCGFSYPLYFHMKLFYPLVARGVKRTVKCCKRKIAAPHPISPNPPFQFRTYVQPTHPHFPKVSSHQTNKKNFSYTPFHPQFPHKRKGGVRTKDFFITRDVEIRGHFLLFFLGN